jgi:hypothetical protein
MCCTAVPRTISNPFWNSTDVVAPGTKGLEAIARFLAGHQRS